MQFGVPVGRCLKRALNSILGSRDFRGWRGVKRKSHMCNFLERETVPKLKLSKVQIN